MWTPWRGEQRPAGLAACHCGLTTTAMFVHSCIIRNHCFSISHIKICSCILLFWHYFCTWTPISPFPYQSQFILWVVISTETKSLFFLSGYFFLWPISLSVLAAPSITSYYQCYAIFLLKLDLELFLLNAFSFISKSHLIKFSLPSLVHSKHCLPLAIQTLNAILSMVSFGHLSRETWSLITLSTTISLGNSKMPCMTISWKPSFLWRKKKKTKTKTPKGLNVMIKHHYF